ncbi:ribosome biogenesis protein alb1 [Scheffersomyces spartinae]|uniref:Ribosome biogenesis protein alb1 n=1 Tax=Scheffersomyces spartinae TaxID=45513 RepID=A0A9P7V8Q5_9ASCO|nr:ribosome biogenesis protein alb1 [Scheffersomyces spartinae]KAG7193368.1 ribosome biogenesis protein alb1 [Scheffersomyces spartinae]
MAHKNSINKPKIKIQSQKHASAIGKKRAARSRNVPATKSSTSRNSSGVAPTPTESKAVALFTGSIKPTGLITNNTLSNKRAKKLTRNAKYIAQRKEKLEIDLMAKQEGAMDLDEEKQTTKTNESRKAPSQLDKVKEVLWSAVADNANYKIDVEGEGTTLGVQAF